MAGQNPNICPNAHQQNSAQTHTQYHINAQTRRTFFKTSSRLGFGAVVGVALVALNPAFANYKQSVDSKTRADSKAQNTASKGINTSKKENNGICYIK